MQLQDQHTAASRALATVRAQAEAKERQRRIAEITLGEINAVPDDDGSKLYRGVGKMCVLGPGALLGPCEGAARVAPLRSPSDCRCGPPLALLGWFEAT